MIKKPILQYKPPETTNKKQQNIQTMFNNMNKQQDTEKQTTPVRKPNNTKSSGQKIKKVSKTAEKKTRKESEKKNIKQLQGFWVKFAEDQKRRRLSQNRPPEFAGTDQPDCNGPGKPSTPVQNCEDVLENSNRVKVLKSENSTNLPTTSRIQIGQDKRLYKKS